MHQVMHALMHYLIKQTNHFTGRSLCDIPVYGHSYRSTDRVFKRLDQLLRKHSTIITKQEYICSDSQVVSIKCLVEDWSIDNTKALSNIDGCFICFEGISEYKTMFIEKDFSVINMQPSH